MAKRTTYNDIILEELASQDSADVLEDVAKKDGDEILSELAAKDSVDVLQDVARAKQVPAAFAGVRASAGGKIPQSIAVKKTPKQSESRSATPSSLSSVSIDLGYKKPDNNAAKSGPEILRKAARTGLKVDSFSNKMQPGVSKGYVQTKQGFRQANTHGNAATNVILGGDGSHGGRVAYPTNPGSVVNSAKKNVAAATRALPGLARNIGQGAKATGEFGRRIDNAEIVGAMIGDGTDRAVGTNTAEVDAYIYGEGAGAASIQAYGKMPMVHPAAKRGAIGDNYSKRLDEAMGRKPGMVSLGGTPSASPKPTNMVPLGQEVSKAMVVPEQQIVYLAQKKTGSEKKQSTLSKILSGLGIKSSSNQQGGR